MPRGGFRERSGRKKVLANPPGQIIPLWFQIGLHCEMENGQIRSGLREQRLGELLAEYEEAIEPARRLSLSERRKWFDPNGEPLTPAARRHRQRVQTAIDALSEDLSSSRQGELRGRYLRLKAVRPERAQGTLRMKTPRSIRAEVIGKVWAAWSPQLPKLTRRLVEQAWKDYRKFESEKIEELDLDTVSGKPSPDHV